MHKFYSKQLMHKDHGLRKKTTWIGSKKRAGVYMLEKKEKSGYGTNFICSVPKKDHRRLWTLF